MNGFVEFMRLREDGNSPVLVFGRELQGAFGGAFGGLLAASSVHVARRAAPGREPAGLDCRFLRPLPSGEVLAATTVLHAGRSLTCVRVDLIDAHEQVATTATVSLVDPASLFPLDMAGTTAPEPERIRRWSTPAGIDAPIIELLDPHLGSLGAGVISADVLVPWEDDNGCTSAEAACVAADLAVGPPVAAACEGSWLPHPNPDLSLRFAPVGRVGPRVRGVGRVVRIAGGQAVVGIDVYSAGVPFALGAATSMVLQAERPPKAERPAAGATEGSI